MKRKRGRPTLEESEEIDSAIIESAMSNFRKRGFDATQLEQIGADAGVSKRTLYNKYKSK